MLHRWARPWFAVTAGCVAVAVLVQVVVAVADPSFFGGSAVGRGLNVFAFFTIASNLLVGLASLLLALDPDRASTRVAVLRLTGVVAITVTFVVFHVALTGLVDLSPWGAVANQLLHTVVPLLAVVGWLAFGPRGRTSARVTGLTLLFPVGWLAFTLVRGPFASDWYPYPFLDVAELGYPRVVLNAVVVAVLFVALAAGATRLDRVLARRAGTVGAPRR